MYPDITIVKSLLLKENYISEADSQAAEAVAKDSAGYIEYLIRAELLSKPLLGQALAEGYKLPYADLGTNRPDKVQVNKIPEALAKANRIVVARFADDAVVVASDTPDKVDAIALQQLFPGAQLSLAYTLPEYISSAFEQYEQPLETRFSKIISSSKRVAPEIVDEIIKDALGFRASDIHFEPRGAAISVRFRVDGTLREAGSLPREYY
ncbi:MAG: hypothetical protein AAB834_07825, partial [Patescibacteria group bacterium]